MYPNRRPDNFTGEFFLLHACLLVSCLPAVVPLRGTKVGLPP